MSKPKTKKTITLAEVLNVLDAHGVADARHKLESRLGARLSLSGVIGKVIKRDGLKLHLTAQCSDSSDRSMKVFANITDSRECERFKTLKLRKGKSVSVTGDLQSFGYEAICLENCLIKG